MTRLTWTRTAPETHEIEEITAMTDIDLPADLADLDVVLPVAALARLTAPGSPRWAFTVLAADLCGPWRRVPRVSAEVLERGLPARPAGPRKIFTGTKLVKTPGGPIDQPVYRDGEWLPAQPAVPPLKGLLDLAGTGGALLTLVEFLDGLAGVEDVPVEPDAPEGWTVESWAPMRTILSGQVPPPLRWTAPAGGHRRPELAAIRPDARPVRLVGVPRSAPPIFRELPGIAGIVAFDARLLAVAALVRHATAHGLQAEREDVARVLGWVVGPERGVAPVTGRGTFAVEWSVPGVTEADQLLAVADLGEIANQLLTESDEHTSAA
jgi:hypothetical protein